MTRSRYLLLCALVLVGAFAGSFAGSRALPVVHAQVMTPTAINGTSFTLVDSRGNTQAVLRSNASGGGIVILDAQGRITWSSPRSGVMPATN
jgi:hypothetical protein